MKFLKHFTGQPFVLATGIAALIHSTWSLGTLFSGEQPYVENITTWIEWIHFAGWILPALLIAIALDVGQVVTSHEIRTSGLTWQRGLTFFVFAFATYYLQWLYIVHHMPELDLSAGVSDVYRGFAGTMRDTGMWLIPLLLPLSTLLYTFSGEQQEAKNMLSETAMTEVTISKVKDTEPPLLEAKAANNMLDDSHLLLFEGNETVNLLWCPDCGWNTGERESIEIAQRSLRAHQARCEKVDCEVQ